MHRETTCKHYEEQRGKVEIDLTTAYGAKA